MKNQSSNVKAQEKFHEQMLKSACHSAIAGAARGLFTFFIGSFCGALSFVVGASVVAADADDPAAELASFDVADGFAVNLFASEKDGVIKPIQMRFDARGRVWVIGSTVYPQIEPGQGPNDKVAILEDTDGDGRCDKTTVFADGLMIPTGIELGNGGARRHRCL